MKAQKISDLKPAQRREAWNKLERFGVGPDRVLALLDADDAMMQRVAEAWPIFQPYVYDTTAIFGFGQPSTVNLPKPKDGEMIIRYDGWSLQELRNCAIVRERNLMLRYRQDWCYKYQWSTEKLPAGNYCLRIPVQDSNRKTFDEQKQLLSADEQPTPIVLVATALLAHLLQTGKDLLMGTWTRCREQTGDGRRVGLNFAGRQLCISSDREDECFGRLWLSSVRTS